MSKRNQRHVKQSGQAFFRRQSEDIGRQLAFLASGPKAVHVHARGTVLSSMEATACISDAVREEHGNNAVPVYHRFRRVV